MKLFMGLDVISFNMKVCLLDGKDNRLQSFTVSNDLPRATNYVMLFLNVRKTIRQICIELDLSLRLFMVFIHSCFGIKTHHFKCLVCKCLSRILNKLLTLKRVIVTLIRPMKEKQHFLQHLRFKCNPLQK